MAVKNITNISVRPKTLKRFNILKYSFEENLIGDDLVNKALDALEKERNASRT